MSAKLPDADAIRAALAPTLARRLGLVESVPALDSTNAEALRRSAQLPDLALILADAQQAGRGRRGRTWQSPPGANVYASLHWRHRLTPPRLAGLSLVVGVACAEALHDLGAPEVRVKWPNDLVARGAKLGGVLVELAPDAAVIGIGLNLCLPAAAAAPIEQAWTDLAALGLTPGRETVVAALLGRLLPALDQFQAYGWATFAARWAALDALAGVPVVAHTGAEVLRGEARGLAPDGGLRLWVEGQERVLHSADVSVRAGGPAASAAPEPPEARAWGAQEASEDARAPEAPPR